MANPEDSILISPEAAPKSTALDGGDDEQVEAYMMKDVRSLRDENSKAISQWWESIPQSLSLDENAERIVNIGHADIQPDQMDEETLDVCGRLAQALQLREKYAWTPDPPSLPKKIPEPSLFDPSTVTYPEATEHVIQFVNGIYNVFADVEAELQNQPLFHVPTAAEYFVDVAGMNKIIAFGPTKTFTYNRLKLLDAKFRMYQLCNEEKELLEQKSVPGRDFYNVRKVDTHVHHAASMNQKHLLKFMKRKLKDSPDDVVIFRDGRYLTLREVFESIHMTAHDLSVDTLDVHADKKSFHRFDRFNLKYNPFGVSRLREIFLKTDNHIHGKYLAELTREVIGELENSKYQHAEYRLGIYGKDISEWDKLAAWVVDNGLFSKHVRWMVQIPRLYSSYKAAGVIDSFETMIRNIFQPLFEVTKDPSSHPKLHILLHQMTGFDCVDDESQPERRIPPTNVPTPAEWNTKHDPPYMYYLGYIYLNLKWLNLFRHSKGLSTFHFRPHAGEAGDIEHLSAAFLCSYGINHGIQLKLSPVLQYLYYISQIGISMSPLSNNSLFLDYQASPFLKFFERGLNVSLSTDGPLQFHFTREPLIEEYSIAAQMWKLNSADLCEIARNSCTQSGFEHSVKACWLGENYLLEGTRGNDMYKTKVPNSRRAFRHELIQGEKRLIRAAQTNAQQTTPQRQPPKETARPVPPSPVPRFVARDMPLTVSPRLLQRQALLAGEQQQQQQQTHLLAVAKTSPSKPTTPGEPAPPATPSEK